jgi:hypothetical protein
MLDVFGINLKRVLVEKRETTVDSPECDPNESLMAYVA